ncbi:hypothetical protein Tco_1407245 [Tanacetum coccineum]
MAHVNATSIGHLEKEEPRSKGIKSPSKLLFPKYLSQSSLEEQNRNPSSPKHVYFIISIILLRKGNEPIEGENVEPDAAKDKDYEITIEAKEEFEEESEEVEEETKEETKEEEGDDPEYFDMLPMIDELRY